MRDIRADAGSHSAILGQGDVHPGGVVEVVQSYRADVEAARDDDSRIENLRNPGTSITRLPSAFINSFIDVACGTSVLCGGPMNSAYSLAFVIGLLSALHCIGMCGGIMGALSFSLHARASRDWPRFALFLLAYNCGRVVSYALVGALFGSLGEALTRVGDGVWLHDLLRWLAAMIVVGIGLYIAGWFPGFTLIERVGEPVWRRLEPIGRSLLPVRTLSRAALYGAVWGWLPCGLVYTMLISTPARADPVAGALYMALFGLGTLPMMFAMGFFAGRLYRFAGNSRLQVASGLVVVALGLSTLLFQRYNLDAL